MAKILKVIRNFFNISNDEYQVIKKVSICPVMLQVEESFTLQMRDSLGWKDIKTFNNLDYCIIYKEEHIKFINNQNETIIKI